MKRTVEIFVAGCPICRDTVELVRSLACESCEVEVLDVSSDPSAQAKAARYGLRRVPAVAVNGELAECCRQGVSEDALRAVGIGIPS